MGKIQYILNNHEVRIEDTEFGEKVIFRTVIPVNDKDRILDEITEATGAKAVYDVKEEVFG